ncbi:MAG: ATP-binding cassette domain-containing protein [Sandaracinaceae bacterium]|nr:ATP-binding cassette domain-containing protein [Sandaracinaceae bacterium]
MSIVRVEHVSHFFGKLQVLNDVSFSVGANEVMGFIGPNGAGKTTTLRMLATLL